MTARALALTLTVFTLTGGMMTTPAFADSGRADGEASGLVLPNLTHHEAAVLRERGLFVSPDMVQTRPAALAPLYISLAALNVADVFSTTAALNNGAYEANPLMRPAAESQGAMLAAKAVATAGTIYATERMWKRGNRVGAIATMVVINGAMAAVVAHNMRNAQAGR